MPANAGGLEQPGGEQVEARRERTGGLRPVAGDNQNSADARLADDALKEVGEHRAIGNAARRDMRHRHEAGAAQTRRGVGHDAMVAVRQEVDENLGARIELIVQSRDGVRPAGRDLDGGVAEQIDSNGAKREARRSPSSRPVSRAGAR